MKKSRKKHIVKRRRPRLRLYLIGLGTLWKGSVDRGWVGRQNGRQNFDDSCQLIFIHNGFGHLRLLITLNMNFTTGKLVVLLAVLGIGLGFVNFFLVSRFNRQQQSALERNGSKVSL